jgi:hypothetical protein
MTTDDIYEYLAEGVDQRAIWECALQLSIIASKLPGLDAGSLAELQNMKESLEDDLADLRERHARLVKDMKLAKVHMDQASMCSKPSEIYTHIGHAKGCLEPK